MEPKVKAIEKVESRPVQNELTLGPVAASEKDGGREDALKTLHDPVAPLAVFEEAEKVEHLRGSVESHNPAALTDRKRRHPNRNEAVLAER
jgi:hypothetical protein